MLILTRKPGEILKIQDTISVVVSKVKNYSVQLGVEAPPEVPVYRKEIYSRIQKEKTISK